MIVASVIRSALKADTAVQALAGGRIFITEVPQDSKRPNVCIMLMADGSDWTLDGPDCLEDGVVRVYSRGDNVTESSELGKAVKKALQGYSGTDFNEKVLRCAHRNTTGDYQDGAKCYRQIDDFRVHHTEE